MRHLILRVATFVLVPMLLAAGCGPVEDGGPAVEPSATRETPVSASPQVEWEKTFGGAQEDQVWSVVEASDGGYAIAGYTASQGTGARDLWLIKIDGGGDEEWNTVLGGAYNDGAMSLQQTSDGGYVVAGGAESYGAREGDAWLVKMDGKGSEQWSTTFGGPGTDLATSVQQTSDGGYILAGWTESYGAGAMDLWLVKTDESGREDWSQTFGGPEEDLGYSVEQTADGGYVVAGWTQSYGEGGWDYWLLKIDEAGELSWDRTFGDVDNDQAWSVQQTSDGGFIVGGGGGLWLLKADADGNEEWRKEFSAGQGAVNCVEQTSDGGYVAVGPVREDGAEPSDLWLVKLDAVGEQEWVRTLGGADFDFPMSVRQTSDGGYIVAGWTMSSGAGGMDCWVVKFR